MLFRSPAHKWGRSDYVVFTNMKEGSDLPVENLPDWAETGGQNFVKRPGHRQWLMAQAAALFDFFQPNVINTAGGFHTLDNTGRPLPPDPGHNGCERQLHDTSRMVHCFAIAKLLGRQVGRAHV